MPIAIEIAAVLLAAIPQIGDQDFLRLALSLARDDFLAVIATRLRFNSQPKQ
ncbi:MAG: hypothetical protein AAF609_16780 [Cyanobacteria bacterium P01_C01_bin.120]